MVNACLGELVNVLSGIAPNRGTMRHEAVIRADELTAVRTVERGLFNVCWIMQWEVRMDKVEAESFGVCKYGNRVEGVG